MPHRKCPDCRRAEEPWGVIIDSALLLLLLRETPFSANVGAMWSSIRVGVEVDIISKTDKARRVTDSRRWICIPIVLARGHIVDDYSH